MSEPITLFLISLASMAIGAFLGRYFQSLKTSSITSAAQERENQLRASLEEHRSKIDILNDEKEHIRSEKDALAIELSSRNTEFENLKSKMDEQKEEVKQLQEKFTKEFENLANKILEEKSNKFTEQNRENIKNILNPLQDKIKDFEEKVERSQKESVGLHASLKEQLQFLEKQNLNTTKEAETLTKALNGESTTQGNWGELILERVLEKSGLDKGLMYETQQSFTTETGNRLQPDVIINLPDGKKMVVDAKVSLTAYERYANEEDEDLKNNHLKEHVRSIKKHVEDLSGKNYHDLLGIDSPDFVLLFIPIEPAFAVALHEDDTLYSKAFEKNIVIVTPTTLLATLRTIDSMWTNQKQQENALEIARQAGALYDKFEGFVTDLIGIGKKMDDAKVEYGKAMNKLVDGRGNIVTSIQKLKPMGAKAKKSTPDSLLKRANENDQLNP